MDFVSWIGFAAGALTSIAYVPQVLKILREKSAEDISIKTMLVLGTGLLLWIVFGLVKGDAPIIVGNTVSLMLVTTVLGLKFK